MDSGRPQDVEDSINKSTFPTVLPEWTNLHSLVVNASIASYHAEPKATGSFELFPKLPPEIRLKIWQHAISVPRIVDFEKIPSIDGRYTKSNGAYYDGRWRYRNTLPPPLLSTNCESRREALKAYKNYENFDDITTSIGGPEWFRYDWDILHLKDMSFSERGKGFADPGFDRIRRWDQQDCRWTTWEPEDGTEKWLGAPDSFEKVQALAINRELFFSTHDDCECIIRHFFPDLRMLIILIDDGIGEIEKIWGIQDGDFGPYEDDWGDFCPRWAFAMASTGPFTDVGVDNILYADYIDRDLERRFKKEEEDYEDESYLSPLIMVMGCSLPPGKKIRECGRWPLGYEPGDEDSLSGFESSAVEETEDGTSEAEADEDDDLSVEDE
ncbi:hypothetical protein L207DRAFT_510343 [Hyaloscypha variabilis F]|uniref:2EXR domain-containing protein n=1 Tax=Hyaloscypha variabilis (strain UAMH 11265 / GT02V1 / F) TaxID=1149755 RepID=A0A2J6RU42_HYAVF|nr:hypothetical protein L207DRAFT_510343 [Hyaloscypha variabilis F]